MAENNVINGKKKALLAFKEKLLDEIKYYEKSIDDLRANVKNNNFYDDLADSSDSDDDFPTPVDMGPSITQLKQQQSMLNTCLRATEELTSLTILQSSVDLLVEEPKFEGEPPVNEPGTWREVIAECRIDLIHFTMSFFMHTPDRKFGQASYRALRVVPVKPTHELELSKSVLHSIKVPSDAVEVLRSYAAGYRSRRTTLARLADKYTNALFMEPHPEGGFVMKCADLLEVSWRLENKRSPIAPFHHNMKFDLEFMEESYVKIITQAHKQLLNPALPTDERTLLLAKIITTCLEARGPIDPESDLESKTTERDNDIDKRDSEVMAPPKSLPKKSKQKSKEVTTAQKRSIEDENGDSKAKKMKNDALEAKKSIVDASSNPRKTKINDGDTESGKKRKISELNKVASAKNVKESGNTEDGDVNNKEDNTGNTKPKNAKLSDGKAKNLKEAEETNVNRNSKSNAKESMSNDDKNTKTKNQIVKETGDTASKEKNTKTKNKNLKEPAKNVKESVNIDGNTKSKTKIDKEISKKQENDNIEGVLEKNTKNDKDKPSGSKIVEKNIKNVEKIKTTVNKIVENNAKDDKKTKTVENKVKEGDKNKASATKIVEKTAKDVDKNKASATKSNTKESVNAEKVKNVVNKPKNAPTKETEKSEDNNQDDKTKNIEKKKSKTVTNTKSKENIDSNKDAGLPKTKVSEKIISKEKNTNKVSEKANNNEKNTNKIDNKPKDNDSAKAKNVANTKNDKQVTKKPSEKNTNTKNDEVPKKVLEKKIANKESNINVANTKNDELKKVSEKKFASKEKVTEVANKDKNIKEKTVNTNAKSVTQIVKKVTEKNATNLRIKDKISQITEKKVTEKPTQLKNVPDKVLNSNLPTNKTKELTNSAKNINKKPPITKIASHRNSLKPQNPPKILKAGNIKPVSTGNTEKENGGKGSKIPQKKMSIISEGSSKKNMLRISPRKLPSKFKTVPQAMLKQKMVKSTNIPRE
ncbi:hypothetical protein PYW07_013373 [Mythimna separata]|uniref:Uncharacterized protein n=1 Tax=Mythimna separata TaxID=271217 RepID=A0AAD8DK69_MYTSE|nr:hypothetical protein PYW07_013373 [Mythimna separata]